MPCIEPILNANKNRRKKNHQTTVDRINLCYLLFLIATRTHRCTPNETQICSAYVKWQSGWKPINILLWLFSTNRFRIEYVSLRLCFYVVVCVCWCERALHTIYFIAHNRYSLLSIYDFSRLFLFQINDK